MSFFRKLAHIPKLFHHASATETKITTHTDAEETSATDESREERIRRVDEVVRKYRQRTYLEEMNEILKMNMYVSSAADHNHVSANAEWLLKQKAPEDMTPEERCLAVELCCIAGDYQLLRAIRQLDDN